MATIRYYTRTKVEKLAPVYLRFQDGREVDIRIITPFKIFPSYWSMKKQAIKPGVLFSEQFTQNDASNFENTLDDLKRAVLREYNNTSATITAEWMKGVIDKVCNKGAPKEETLIQYIERFVKEAKTGHRLTSGARNKKKYTYGTVRVLTGFKQSFEHFCNGKGKNYNFNDINQDFYNDYIQFFYDRNCSANYIGRRIRTLKQIMEASRNEGLHNNTAYKLRSFKSISVETDKIYLKPEEIKKLYKLDLTENKEWEFIRDKFLIGVYSGQRFSDFNRISKEDIKTIGGKKIIELSSKKTNTRTFIPVRPELEIILNRYPEMKKISDQYLNREIKKIAAKAEIKDMVFVKSFPGGMETIKKEPKYKLISSHCARRSFCTNAYLAGIPIPDCMRISGHKSPEEFLKYVRIDSLETAIKLSDNEFFKGNTLKVVG